MKIYINKVRGLKYGIAAVLVAVTVMLVMFIPGCAGENEAEGAIKVAADIVPLADFCRNVGGDAIEVEVLVPPGSSPHSYELSSGQMRFLADADVLVTDGLDLTPWAEEIYTKADNPDLVIVVAGEVVPQSELITAMNTQQEDEHGIHDPHIWLDPELAADVVGAIRDSFVEVDPQNASLYTDNAHKYLEELAVLDSEIQAGVEGFARREFIAFHSSWTYFAARYGLRQVGVIEELPGKEPSAAGIAALVNLVKEQGVTAIFAEPQFSQRAAEAIAEESGGEVEVFILDPLGDPTNPETDTYLKMMRHDLAVMGEALR